MSLRICPTAPVWWGLVLAMVVLVAGCEDTPRDKLSDGRQALANGQLEEAEEYIQSAIQADPDLVAARKLLVKTYMEAERFEAAEEELERIWANQQFDQEGGLSSDQRRTRQVVNEQFRDLYQRWARSIDVDEDPDKFEEISWRGLNRRSRDEVLNPMLVEFYQQRADRHIERGERVKAAEQLERVDDLREFPDTRQEALERAHNLRRDAFSEQARQRFERVLQPDLLEAGAYDPESETIRLDIEQPLDRRLRPDDQEAVDQARTMAVQTLVPTLAQFALTLSDGEADGIEFSALQIPELRILDEQFRPGRYDMTVALDLPDLIEMSFAYAEYERTAGPEITPDDIDADTGEIAIDDGTIELDTSAVDGD